MKKQIALIAVLTLTAAGFLGIAADSSDAAGFDITDGTGRTFHYDQPSEHIVVAGFAVTLTMIDLGFADKIVATDTYGGYDYYKEPKLEVIKDLPSIGSIGSAANNENIIAQLVQWVEDKTLSLDDTIVFTTYVTNGAVLRAELDKRGFEHVLMWGSISEYGKIADMVDTLSMAMSGKKSTVAEDMRLAQSTVSEKTEGVAKEDAIFVWWSASVGFKVGKSGSLAVSLIEAAGGRSLGQSTGSGSTYGDQNTIIQLLESNRDALVLLDSSYVKAHGAEKFRNDVLNGDKEIKILPMEQTWNNYCPESADGLWAIAGALYPDIFGGEDRPISNSGSDNPNVILYSIAGIVIVAIVIGAFFVLRRP
ncbi:MAG: hypothetical protein LBR42_04750 [Candidatus Methanoplasma sp.]|jgi:ABC-type Fe3+-hydroxamate transport system substrate-binding protein|nr:hypothetical protein [Candidatus Methanoplasma sp.]